jgi:hypothetical protein
VRQGGVSIAASMAFMENIIKLPGNIWLICLGVAKNIAFSKEKTAILNLGILPLRLSGRIRFCSHSRLVNPTIKK